MTTKKKPTKKSAAQETDVVDEARTKFTALQDELNSIFVEREDLINTTLTALVAGQHVLMLGPPGTAKSMLAEALTTALDGQIFRYLLSRETSQAEILGPLSIPALEQGKVERSTAGMLPEADFAFLDEVFKGNAAVLNSLLSAINERCVHIGGQRVDIPLKMVVAASNELPADEDGLEAFHDRFLVRHYVNRIEDELFKKKILFDDVPEVTPSTVTFGDVDVLRKHAGTIQVGDDAKDAIVAIHEECIGESIRVSDRRMKQSVHFLKCHAARRGDKVVDTRYMKTLAHVLWNSPTERETVERIVEKFAAKWAVVLDEARQVLKEQQVKLDNIRKEHTRSPVLTGAMEAMDHVDRTIVDMKSLANDEPMAKGDAERVLAMAEGLKNDLIEQSKRALTLD